MIPGKRYTADDYLRIAWRRKWIILVPLFVISIGTFVVVKRLPNQYRAQTTILVVPQRVPDAYVHATVTSTIDDRLRSISDAILSRPRLERIIRDYSLYPALRRKAPLEDIVEQMRRDITVEPAKGGSTFVISYTSGDARVAQSVTETLASMFIEANLHDRVTLADGTSQFLESQLEDARQRLVAHEKKLETFREKYAGELPEQLDTNTQAMQNAESHVQAIAESINRDRDRKLLQERLLADLQTADISVPAPVGAGVHADPTPAEQLEAARATLAALELRYKPDHPDVIRARREVQRLAAAPSLERARPTVSEGQPARLTAAEAAGRNKVRELQLETQNLDRQIAEKEAEQQRLNGEIASYQRRIAAVPTHESEMTELMRDYDTLQKTYTSLLARKEDSKTAADLERRQIGEQFKVVDPAREPERPISPKRPQLYAMGIITGLALGLGLAGLLEYRDSSLKTEDDVVQTLMLPVLALIPTMGASTRQRGLQKYRAGLPWVALMYERFYGLAERPFELTPDPRYLFLSPRHAEALSMLEYGTRRRNGLTLLVGEAGTGKTTLIYAALERQQAENVLHVFLTNPALTRDEFFDFLACGFGLSGEARTSKSRFLLELSASLTERSAAGGAAALIVDEAQCLSDAVLEEIRLLGNLETTRQKLLSIILIGQPELADRLNAPALRQLKQRVALRCTLAALDLAETTAYIDTRIGVAGADAASIFARTAIEAVHVESGGIPRTIGVICENALINGFALRQRPIGADVIAEVCREYGLPVEGGKASTAAREDVPPTRTSSFFAGA